MTCYRDEIMEDVRRRKADICTEYPTFETLDKHFSEVESRMRNEGWTFIDPVEFREQNRRRQMEK
jgi:hypothetical protein